MEAFFQGERELFQGLAVERLETEWIKYPILHLDLNVKKYESEDDLYKILNRHLEKWEQEYGSPYGERDLEERFLQVVECAYRKTGKRVVIPARIARRISFCLSRQSQHRGDGWGWKGFCICLIRGGG
ncbi:MAG: AAA family ATPase [Prevotella sp.]|nr:AAA family ATPase [Prevotella sp.]